MTDERSVKDGDERQNAIARPEPGDELRLLSSPERVANYGLYTSPIRRNLTSNRDTHALPYHQDRCAAAEAVAVRCSQSISLSAAS